MHLVLADDLELRNVPLQQPVRGERRKRGRRRRRWQQRHRWLAAATGGSSGVGGSSGTGGSGSGTATCATLTACCGASTFPAMYASACQQITGTGKRTPMLERLHGLQKRSAIVPNAPRGAGDADRAVRFHSRLRGRASIDDRRPRGA